MFESACNCNDPKAIRGTSASDTLRGTSKADIICGFDGHDTLTGQGGHDCLYGGVGIDTLDGGGGADKLYGGQDGDTLKGGSGNDLLDGGSGSDNLDGGKNTDTCLNGETVTTCESFSSLKEITPPSKRSEFIAKEGSRLNPFENIKHASNEISSHTGSRVGRISSYIASLRLILASLLFASNAFAQIPPTAFIDLEYFYDGVSNVTGIVDHNDSANNCTMQYDSLDRLTNADGPWGVGSFTYDSVGNRTSKDIAGENINYSYGADNRLSGVVHDANGNIIDDGVFTYTYDSENRLIQVTNGVDVTTYKYDGDGRRISKTVNGEKTYYAYGTGLNVLTEFNSQGIPKFDYIYAGNKNIARVNFDATGTPESKTFYHSDHLGSNIAITDATSTVEWDRVYLPYGEGFNDPNVDFLQNTHEYTAKELDEDIGLYYYGARYYNPAIGRFMSVDPAGGDLTDPQSWNRYAYVQNNPYKYVDPDGEFAIFAAAAIAGIGLLTFPDVANAPATLFDELIPLQSNLELAGKLIVSEIGGYFTAKAISRAVGLVKGFIFGKVVRIVDKGTAPEKLYHYGFSRNADEILKSGLKPGPSGKIYTTPQGNLSPLQAQIDLALPPNRGLRDAVFEIDVAALQKLGIDIPPSTQIGRKYNMPGGELENVFELPLIPQEAIKRVR